jgi:lysophospholipase L1-like esterase
MEYFKRFSSNTCAGSGNQLYFGVPEGEKRVGRVFYRISVGGEYDYSLLFSNIIDSTYSDGSASHKNLICGGWTIHGAKIGKCKSIPSGKSVTEMNVADADEGVISDVIVSELREVTFGGRREKTVMPGEFFSTDPIALNFEKNEYLCLEMIFSGKMIPYHEESLLPVFVREGGAFKYNKKMPFAGMIGCGRAVKGRVAYLGDSITQGIGTPNNSYAHWNAVLSQKLGDEYAYWNLGLGFGRASDAASDGAWLYKAKQNDIIFVCFGVNDIFRGPSEEQIKLDLTYIAETLKKAGKTVIMQTVPPFDYSGDDIGKWNRINEYIKTELKSKVDLVFDVVSVLGREDAPHMARYGGHPDESGCKIWAEALYGQVRRLFLEDSCLGKEP